MSDILRDAESETVDPMVAKGLPQHTTPTWEVELLISGIAVFAMLQLPGWLDDRYFDLASRFDSNWTEALRIGYVYARIGAMILAATFVLHLLLRAQWIALVGMNSVYPQGVRWEGTSLGKQQRALEQMVLGSISDAIERADNRATVVFAVGVYMAVMTIRMFFLVLVTALVLYVASAFVDIGNGGSLMGLLIGLVLFPLGLASLVDRRTGDLLPVDAPIARALRAVFSAYSKMGFGRSSMPGMLLMSSHEGFRRAFAMSFLIVAAAIAITLFQLDLDQHPNLLGNYALLPQGNRDSVDSVMPEHYDDQRGTERLGTIPFVQSQFIADPYLRVVIPIQPALHNAALHRGCPLAGASDGSQLRRITLDCLTRLHPLSVDGHVQTDVHYDLGSDPRAHHPALVAMLDIRPLANGRHELLVAQPAKADKSPSSPDRIPFWR